MLLESAVQRGVQRPFEVFSSGGIFAHQLGCADVGEGVHLDLGLAQTDGELERLASPLERCDDVFRQHLEL